MFRPRPPRRSRPPGGDKIAAGGTQSMRDQQRRALPSRRPGARMELTPDQQERIRRLLEEELRAAYRSAVDSGNAPAAVDALIADRRRALEKLAAGLPDDRQDPLDDPGQGGGIADQR